MIKFMTGIIGYWIALSVMQHEIVIAHNSVYYCYLGLTQLVYSNVAFAWDILDH